MTLPRPARVPRNPSDLAEETEHAANLILPEIKPWPEPGLDSNLGALRPIRHFRQGFPTSISSGSSELSRSSPSKDRAGPLDHLDITFLLEREPIQKATTRQKARREGPRRVGQRSATHLMAELCGGLRFADPPYELGRFLARYRVVVSNPRSMRPSSSAACG